MFYLRTFDFANPPDICNAMKTILKTIFCLLLIISCSKKEENKTPEKRKATLIKIGYYPTFHEPAETILNLNEKFLIFYSPTYYLPEPSPPPNKDGKQNLEREKEYKEYLNERPELKPFKSKLLNDEIIQIQNILKSFYSEDFSDKNVQPTIDGMSTNIVILFSDGKLIQINSLNDSNPKQRELYGEILNLIIEKNTNKNDSVILQRIKKYL